MNHCVVVNVVIEESFPKNLKSNIGFRPKWSFHLTRNKIEN